LTYDVCDKYDTRNERDEYDERDTRNERDEYDERDEYEGLRPFARVLRPFRAVGD